MIRNSRGFATGALLGFAMLGLAACGDNNMAGSLGTGAGATLKVASSNVLGSNYLVDGMGRTLYLFEHDLPAGNGQAATSSCVADPDPSKSCVAFWPIFHANPLVVSGIDTNDVGEITRPDGLKQ